MSRDSKVIEYLTSWELVALMNETAIIAVEETSMIEGRPVVHASLKVRHAKTGEELPGGLPFTVVLMKAAGEKGYSNLAIGTVVPAAELGVQLPANFFNRCNQRFRFVRAFPLDQSAFVLQMDLFVRNTTREFVKFNFGIWAAMFSHVLFELMGRDQPEAEVQTAAAAAYASAPRSLLDQIAPAAADRVILPAEQQPAPATAIEAPPAEAEPQKAESQPQEDPAPVAPETDSAVETPEAETPPAAETEEASAEAPTEPLVEPATSEAEAEAEASPGEAAEPPPVEESEPSPLLVQAAPAVEHAEAA